MVTENFIEKQSFRQWYLWVLLLAPVALFTYAFIQQDILGKPFGDTPANDISLALILLFTIIVNYLFYKATLTTIVNKDGIFYKWSYLNTSFNKLYWHEIEKLEVINYSFLGYGIRLSKKYGTVYNVWGKTGLLVKKKNKAKILIGTQKPVEFQQALDIFYQDKSAHAFQVHQ
ncbi:MAG: hypothetical protein JWQ96_3029 [Segetibacter sp.]|nr:hypothetical protein [Segetibacter sp.]